MIYVFGAIIVVLCLAAIRDEFRDGGSLSLRTPEPDGEPLDMPMHDGWEEHDVLRTLAEIESL